MPQPKVYRSIEKPAELFHDACFEEGESRDAFSEVKLSELVVDDSCESCGGVFLSGLLPDSDEDDNDDATEDDDPSGDEA